MTGLVLLALLLSPSVPPAQPDAAHLQRRIERLAEGGRVLYVAAHPDDENTQLLAWLVQVRRLRAGYLSMTRGEGGQNLLGKEQGPGLGLLRTQELLAARRLDGAEQFFTRARDFGFSKTAEETLRFWGKDRILEDVVWVIRTFRPDVIVTRFSPDDTKTHGHHRASAQLAVEAFRRAADPAFAPDQVKRAGTWQARRIVWNAWPDESKRESPGRVQVEVNRYDPLLGLSMGELAGDSRTMHKSQGFGAPRGVTPDPEQFELLAGEPMRDSFLDGVAEPVASPQVLRALAELRPGQPERAIPALLEELARAPRAEVAEAIAACAGLFLSARAEVATAAPGTPLPLALAALQRVPAGLSLESVRIGALALEDDRQAALEVKGPGALGPAPWLQKTALAELPPPLSSDPAWVRELPEEGFYPVAGLDERVRPEPAPPLVAEFRLRAGAQTFALQRPVVFKWVDPVQGERTRAVELAPPATVDAAAPILLFTDARPRTLRVRVRASAGAVAGAVRLALPEGFTATPVERPFSLSAAGEELETTFELRAAPSARAGELGLALQIGGHTWDRGLRRVEYPHVPPIAWHPPARVRLVRFDVDRGGAREIGYVMGAGDEVPSVLAQLGYRVTALDEAALRERDLSGFDAIVLGVRAYNALPWLAALKPRLFAWVEAGGTLVTQYNTRNWISSLPEPLGPAPFKVSQQRVTDETAAVAFEEPASPLLTTPNRIGPRDFDGWVQERGLYFAGEWDPRYSAPLSLHDPGEPAQRGGLLALRHGKGRFVYTGLAFFRQLPAGVPGAVRLFANLLARTAPPPRARAPRTSTHAG